MTKPPVKNREKVSPQSRTARDKFEKEVFEEQSPSKNNGKGLNVPDLARR